MFSKQFVENQLNLTFGEKLLWTDSHWIKTEKPLTVFVENRLREIRTYKDVEFQYVISLGEMNGPDLLGYQKNRSE